MVPTLISDLHALASGMVEGGVAFAVPGAIGFQEAAYVLIGPLFGLPPEIALALSIAKRGRDIAVGIPALLAWQLFEARSILGRRAA